MPISPGVYTKETDYTTTVPSASSSEGGIAGVFSWGPVDQLVLVDSEATLVKRFGKPTSNNFETWFCASNFLGYTDKLFVSRAIDASNTFSAIANTGAVANLATQVIKNQSHYDTVTINANTAWIAKYPGELGNSLRVSSCDSVNAYSQSLALIANSSVSNVSTETFFTVTAGANSGQIQILSGANATVSSTVLTSVLASISVGDIIEVGNTTTGRALLKVTSKGVMANTSNATAFMCSANVSFSSPLNFVTNATSQTVERRWEYFNQVSRAPGTSAWAYKAGSTAVDEIHVVVVDEDGKFTGVPGNILEVFPAMSRATDSRQESGGSNFYKTVINTVSPYVWVGTIPAGAPAAVATSVANSTNYTPLTYSFVGGADGVTESNISLGSLSVAWDDFASKTDVDVSVLIAGKARGTGNNYAVMANYIVNNLAETRQDLIVAVSPAYESIVNQSNLPQSAVDFRRSAVYSSYVTYDSGYKYQYDKYNDVMRWVPLCGDTAGCIARTDRVAEYFYSPAGPSRGQIKNVVKLAYNPSQAHMDILYKEDINPVVNFPGEGTMLYGDKTGLGKPSAFDRINVRRLFNGMKKVISRAARQQMFEFNDEISRKQFVALVTPYLRDLKGKRGIYDFQVICDTSNNTGEVIDRNEFLATILVKPAKSTNFIILNFVGVKTSAEFSEISSAF